MVVAEAPFGRDDDLFEGHVDIFFATIATNATRAHEATTIMAIFFDVFVVSIGEITLPVLLVITSSSDVMVSLTAGLETGAETGRIVIDGDNDAVGTADIVGTAVGFLKKGLGVLCGSGKLIDKLSDRLSPNNPRKLL